MIGDNFNLLMNWGNAAANRQWCLEKWGNGYECRLYDYGERVASVRAATCAEVIAAAFREAGIK